MMSDREFSVLLPIYNRVSLKSTIVRCLHAIMDSSVLPNEIIIVIDGPLDWNLQDQLSGMPHFHLIRFFELEKNMGLTYALNFGLSKCLYDIIARVDADDFCHPLRFEKQLALYRCGYNLIGGLIQEIDEQGNKLLKRIVPENADKIRKFALRRNPFNHMSVMFSKKLVLDVGCYPDLHLKEDYALWVTLLASPTTKPYNVQEVIMYATAGDGLYARRTSMKIFRQELKMQLFLREKLQKRFIICMLDFIIRTCVHLFPLSIKHKIYSNRLRSK